MQTKLSFVTNPLKLPNRFELLERQVKEIGGELSRIIRKVESTSEHVENLLGKIEMSGNGQFQLFMGESGSGKTTFLRTIPDFFKNVEVESFSENDSFAEIIDAIKSSSHIKGHKIFIIDERDNPTYEVEALKQFFENLRKLFRKEEGQVLLIWPITDQESANEIADIAWKIGKDSISPSTGVIYNFSGLNKSMYYEVADDTIRSLNNGESLDSYGVSEEIANDFLKNCNTIGQFYSEIENFVYELNKKSWKILEKKIKPKIWVLLTGDSTTELDRTVRSLTQGIDYKIDIDRMVAYLDDESNESAYLNSWRKRRADAGFLLRLLDVRLFYLPPNTSLAFARTYAIDSITTVLNKKSEGKTLTKGQIRKSDLYLAITEQTDSSKKSVTHTNEITQDEYLRLQQKARDNDKELNKAIALGLIDVLEEDKFEFVSITAEKQELTGTNLKPDIQILTSQDQAICIESTWRSTGKAVVGEISKKQNTLSTGHIQKYILEKVMEYVDELGL